MYLKLTDIKKHLNLDNEFKEDDNYLLDLQSVAEKTVENHIDTPLALLANKNGGRLPSPVLQAMLLFVGNLYANRESVSYSQVYRVPNSYDYLLDLYKNYGHTKNVNVL